MKKYFVLLFLISTITYINTYGQEEGKIILKIDDHSITQAEFERIYHKNNTAALNDNKSVEEYMQMFINFKLKVIEAENLGYDTLKSFINELAGYRDQLAKPYFEDKKLTDSLLHEAYDRTVKEVSASHILLRLEEKASPKDTAIVYQRIMDIRNRILNGESFSEVAKEVSEDPSAKNNGGYLGWFSAFRMIYPFETVAYNTPEGEISMPFRTQFGYHILKNEGMRDSKGSFQIAHILVYGSQENPEEQEKGLNKINECYQKLLDGGDFGELAAEYSDDRSTSMNKGIVGWFRTGSIPPDLESKVFELKDTGDFTEPIPTKYGWHIIKLLDRKPLESYEELKPELEKKVEKDQRSSVMGDMVLARIQKESGFKVYKENLVPLADILDSTVYTGLWDYSLTNQMINPVISFTNKDYTQYDLAKYISGKKRYSKQLTFQDIVNTSFTDYVKDMTLDYEKSQLENKYPEFRHLMEEYHDGILLFNITDDMVWSKAVKDTSGLEAFYEKNKQNYKWKDRASVSIYLYEDTLLNNKVFEIAKKRANDLFSLEEANAMICPGDTILCVSIEDKKIETDQQPIADGLKWEAGSYVLNKGGNKISLTYVNSILQPEIKKLDEARGLITADYQTYLENEWVQSLREKHSIEINNKVLKKVK